MEFSSKFICKKCGKVEPKTLWHTSPLLYICPKCNNEVIDSNCKFNNLLKVDVKKPWYKFWK